MSLRFLLEGRKGSLDKGGHEYGSIFFFFLKIDRQIARHCETNTNRDHYPQNKLRMILTDVYFFPLYFHINILHDCTFCKVCLRWPRFTFEDKKMIKRMVFELYHSKAQPQAVSFQSDFQSVTERKLRKN